MAMEITVLSIVDSAVKIGLGALIAGASGYLIAKTNKSAEKSLYVLQHKITTLESAIEDIEVYLKAATEFADSLHGFSSVENRSNRLTDNEYSRIKELDELVVNSWPRRDYAVSRFRLLHSKTVVELVWSLNAEFNKKFREPAIFDRKLPDYKYFQNGKLASQKVALRDGMAELYRTITS